MSRLISDTLLLLDLRRQVAWNGFRSRSLARQALVTLLTGLLACAAAAFSVSVGFGAGRLLRRAGDPALEPLLPGALLTLATLLLLAVSFGAALGSLFLASDLDRLMFAPVDRRAVFVAKLLDGMAWYYAILAALAAPALVAYGRALGYGPAYYVLALVALLGTPLFPAGLSALLVMLVVRVAPARRVREVLGLAAALAGVSCSVAGQTSRVWARRLFAPAGGAASPGELLGQVQGFVAAPLPPVLAGSGLAAAGHGDLALAARELSAFFLLTFGVFAGCVVVADTLYASGWVRLQSSGRARRGRAAQRARQPGWLGRAPAALAVAIKDWQAFPRDLRSLPQLLAPLIVLPAVYYNLVAGGSRRSGLVDATSGWVPGPGDLRGVFVAAGVLFVCTMVFNRIALASISREGRAWWVLKAAPLTGLELLGGKLLAVALPYAVLSSLLMAGAAAWGHFGVLGTLYGWLGVQVIGIGMLAVDVALAVPGARLDWDDPRRMTSGWAGIASFLALPALGCAAGGLLCLPLLVRWTCAPPPRAWRRLARLSRTASHPGAGWPLPGRHGCRHGARGDRSAVPTRPRGPASRALRRQRG
jgi:ABC-2 type transport system permease protein